MICARTGDTSDGPSDEPGCASPDSSPRRASRRRTRCRTVASASATSSSLGGVAAWNSNRPCGRLQPRGMACARSTRRAGAGPSQECVVAAETWWIER
jgi:hypothetical protein